ncbi:hypothetical protein RhiirA4_470302 [Rhizophagus irregularis]|uniref:Uncharacterized protein n=1 Tax=Rhizophagus irregularis TaxID=588596 RepID=A0A2I1H180_9GLOM|nr:hypothetical protein RhiirA4_470302 [Rhizophagus irregularis]
MYRTLLTVFKQWEIAQGIMKTKKKRYHHYFKRDRKDTTHTNVASPRPNRVNYTTFALQPYDRIDGRVDYNARIRWTSSNFLHPGTWETYKDTLLFDNIYLYNFFL